MISILIGSIIGLVLGLTGAGGSLFAVPLLILLANYPATTAISLSLGIVGLNAFFGVLLQLKSKNIQWAPALVFLIIGSLSTPLGAMLRTMIPEEILLLSFTLLVIFVAMKLWRSASKDPINAKTTRAVNNTFSHETPICSSTNNTFKIGLPCIIGLTSTAISTGILSGLFGVGGGFIIVPALILITGMTIHQAVASSLVIICAISFSAFSSFLFKTGINEFISLYGNEFLLMILAGFIAMYLSRYLGKKITGPSLQKLFSILMVLMTVVTLMKHYIF